MAHKRGDQFKVRVLPNFRKRDVRGIEGLVRIAGMDDPASVSSSVAVAVHLLTLFTKLRCTRSLSQGKCDLSCCSGDLAHFPASFR